ncbi:MAG TPA: condensation domain-containing protein, partial [Candidatus Kapabacteria bacterium]|nr:condensation domain-containing protein [Candidatus Kapabacteria bacterium]
MRDRKEIQDILPLTPLQQGMLFHSLKESKSDFYFVQLSLTLLGNLEKELCNQAWNAVIDANEMLRTTFQWEKLANPVQIVLKKYLL